MIIWALFDDGFGSWNKLGSNDNIQIISIGINDNDWQNYHKINLSIQNDNLIKELSKLPKPDAIVASPPCESWSIADNQQRLWRKQTGNQIEVFTYSDNKKNNEIVAPNLKRDYFKQWRTTLNGVSTALAVSKIIEHFKPKVYVIENPQTSKIWEFFRENCLIEGINNIAYYNNYDLNYSKKPTNFFSNINLNLKKENIKNGITLEKISGYDIRSSIPKNLLLEILERIKNV